MKIRRTSKATVGVVPSTHVISTHSVHCRESNFFFGQLNVVPYNFTTLGSHTMSSMIPRYLALSSIGRSTNPGFRKLWNLVLGFSAWQKSYTSFYHRLPNYWKNAFFQHYNTILHQLIDHQHGFRTVRSTKTALQLINHHIKNDLKANTLWQNINVEMRLAS